MGDIEPAGLPAVKLEPLRRLLSLDRLSDEDMVNYQRINLLDSSAPNPSVETLLHAFLPHKFVDHTHSTAVLALTDQPDGEKIARETFGESMAYVPYTIPGFALAKSVAAIYQANPQVQGLILLRHGIFTFAEDARTAYELMIEMVSHAEQRIARAQEQSRLPTRNCYRLRHNFAAVCGDCTHHCAARWLWKIPATATPSGKSWLSGRAKKS